MLTNNIIANLIFIYEVLKKLVHSHGLESIITK